MEKIKIVFYIIMNLFFNQVKLSKVHMFYEIFYTHIQEVLNLIFMLYNWEKNTNFMRMFHFQMGHTVDLKSIKFSV